MIKICTRCDKEIPLMPDEKLKPEWFDTIEKYCGDNGLNFGSAFDRHVAMAQVPENNKAVCCKCKDKFDYAITGHILNYLYPMCNKCYFLMLMNTRQTPNESENENE